MSREDDELDFVELLTVAACVLSLVCKLLMKIWGVLVSLWNHLTGETARRQRWQEEARKEEKERQQEEAKERKQFRAENSEVFAGIADLLTTCAAPALAMMRAVVAIEGTDIEVEPKTLIWTDIGFILAAFSRTGSTDDAYLEMLWEEVTRTIEPPDVDGVPPLSVLENHGVKQLGMMLCLGDYDKAQGTTLSSRAAANYLSITSKVYSHCKGSLPIRLVADAYDDLLKPYIEEGGGNAYAGHSTSSADSESNRRLDCEKCVQGYQLLDLPFGASKEEVKQKRRAWAEVLHPDQLSSKSERARDAAEQQLKSINEACDHILTCPVRAKVRDDSNRSERPPAPHQSASETTADDELSNHYATLGIREDATPEEVRQAYRDLAKVWHPDRFNDGDTRLKQKAEKQLKAINDAYAHIQEAQTRNQSASFPDIESTPLEEAINLIMLQFVLLNCKAANIHLAMRNGSTAREEVYTALQEFNTEYVAAVAHLEAIIRRITHETPEAPTAELDSLLLTANELGVEMAEAEAELQSSVTAHEQQQRLAQSQSDGHENDGSAASAPLFGSYMKPQANRHGRFWIAGVVCLAVIICVSVIARRTPAPKQPASSSSSAPATSASQAIERPVAEASAPSTPPAPPASNDSPDSDSPERLAFATSQSADEESIQEAVDHWANAFRARDAERFADSYAPNVEQFFGRKNVSQSRIRDIYQAAFGRIEAIYTYDISDLHIGFPDVPQYPPRATATYIKRWDTAETSGKGNSGEEVERLTFEKTDDGWRIVREEELHVIQSSRQ